MVADPSVDAIWLCGPNHARVENIEAICDAVTAGKGGFQGSGAERNSKVSSRPSKPTKAARTS